MVYGIWIVTRFGEPWQKGPVIIKPTSPDIMEMLLRYNSVDEHHARYTVRKGEEYIKQQKAVCSLCAPATLQHIYITVSH